MYWVWLFELILLGTSGIYAGHGVSCSSTVDCPNAVCNDNVCGLGCLENWTGGRCNMYTGCIKGPCENGGICQSEPVGDQICSCPTGYYGSYCETNHCQEMPCQNGATCNSFPDKYNCTCASGFYGNNCEQVQCGGDCPDGYCSASTGHCLSCADHWYGPECENFDCHENPCKNGGNCQPNPVCQCPEGYHGTHCEIIPCLGDCPDGYCNASTGHCLSCADHWYGPECENFDCHENPCENGGNCQPYPVCQCPEGYHGTYCEINHCQEMPCQNGATCNSFPDKYNCTCASGFYGNNCEQGICDPTKSDVIFVLDASHGMGDVMFRKQLDFITSFIDNVTISPNNFQMSVITFSFRGKIEFDLDTYTNNVDLKEAVNTIQYRPGATFTERGLDLVQNVTLASTRRDDTSVTRFVILMADGLSTNRMNAVAAAEKIKNSGTFHRLLAIGIGDSVLHQELVDIASKPDSVTPSYVFSIQNSNAIFTVIKILVHITCEEYVRSEFSEVVVLLDTSKDGGFVVNKEAMDNFIDRIPTNPSTDGTRMTLMTFNDSAHVLTTVTTETDKQNAHVKLAAVLRSETTTADVAAALQTIHSDILQSLNIERKSARKFVIVFSNGNFKNTNDNSLEQIKTVLDTYPCTLLAVTSGSGINIDNLVRFGGDPYNVIYIQDKQFSVLEVLNSFTSYNTFV